MRLSIILFSVVYALVRYVAFAPQNAQNVPVFILNKAVSMAAALILVAGLRERHRGNADKAGNCFRTGLALVVAHVPMSLMLLRPGYFPEFFVADGSRMQVWGELVVMFGASALGLAWAISQQHIASGWRERAGLGLLLIIAAHVGAMGICRGINMGAKHAYLPPMWLLSLLAALAGFVWGSWKLWKSRA